MKIPWRYLPPNLATYASVCIGVAAIREALSGDSENAAWLVLLCMLFDKVDGALARALKAQSRFGVEMDSFADFVSFGLAPGFLIISLDQGTPWVGFAFACVYIGACLARLVRFNVEDADALPDRFRGLPSTVAGGLVAGVVLVGQKHGLTGSAEALALRVASLVLAAGMISALPLPKFGKTGVKFLDIMMYVGVLSAAVTIVLRIWPEFILAQAMIYLVFGSIVAIARPVAPPARD